MMELLWTPEAISDRNAIYDNLEAKNPLAALDIDDLISTKTAMLEDHPRAGREGRLANTFELVIHSNYMAVYEIVDEQVWLLNIVHTARQWPPIDQNA